MIIMSEGFKATPGSEDGAQHDPAGEAALLLVESLIHGLIGKSVISVADAVEAINVAAEIRIELGEDRCEDRQTVERSAALLTAMSRSLTPDIED
jgi:hypothetical protein